MGRPCRSTAHLVAGLALVAAACRPPAFVPTRHLQAVGEAQAAFFEAAGRFESLDCLRSRAACGTEAPGWSPSLTREQADANPFAGWAGRLYLRADGRRFAYLLVPLDAGPRDPGFCLDDTGSIRVAEGERLAVLDDGRCPRDWAPVGEAGP